MGGEDGFHDMWDADPLTDLSSVGISTTENFVEVESEHHMLKRKLLAHFTYRKNNENIVLLKLKTTVISSALRKSLASAGRDPKFF